MTKPSGTETTRGKKNPSDWFEEVPEQIRVNAFREQGDLDGLVRFLEAELERADSEASPGWLERQLAETLVLRGDTERARRILVPLHQKEPTDPWVHRSILDVLMAEGLDWDTFHWILPPIVRKLDDELLNSCAEMARAQGGWIGLDELFDRLPPDLDAFAFFTTEDLARALLHDDRFVLDFEDDPVVFLVDASHIAKETRQDDA